MWAAGGRGKVSQGLASGQDKQQKVNVYFAIVIDTMLVIGGVELNPGPINDTEKTSIKCGTCKKNLRVGVLCNGCEAWFHLGCQKIKRDQIIEETWVCRDCGTNSARNELDTLRDENKTLREKLERAEQRVKDLEEENVRLRQRKEKGSAECVVIGDSMVRYVAEENPELEVECYPGIGVEKMKDIIEQRERGEPKKIILHVGTNDLRRRSVDYIMADLYDLVSSTKKRYPTADIIISGIVRRRDINWRKVGRANKAFEWVAEQMGTRYVDGNAWLDDRDFGRDGVHLNRRGTAAMGALFARVAATPREDRSQQ